MQNLVDTTQALRLCVQSYDPGWQYDILSWSAGCIRATCLIVHRAALQGTMVSLCRKLL